MVSQNKNCCKAFPASGPRLPPPRSGVWAISGCREGLGAAWESKGAMEPSITRSN